jgi:hypothetical protein
MIILLICILILMLVVLAIVVGMAFLLVKITNHMENVWLELEQQRLSVQRLIGWAGGVVPVERNELQ